MDGDSGPVYAPDVFDVGDVEHAKVVILNPDGVHTPAERWKIETEYLLGLMAQWVPLSDASVLDWGCGIGRLARPLIERHGCAVLGVDISSSMRALAVEYVNSPNFVACDPFMLPLFDRFRVQFDCALAVWVLQHAADFAGDVAMIRRLLKPGGRLFVLSSRYRFVPGRINGEFSWIDDNVDMMTVLDHDFVTLQVQRFDEAIVPSPPSFYAVFERDSAWPTPTSDPR